MRLVYNTNLYKTFTIEKFQPDVPLYIKCNNVFISAHKLYNIVYMFKRTNESLQEWIFEEDPEEHDIYYIRSNYERPSGIKYLGSPNKNSIVYLYTTKNRFTKWRISPKGDSYVIEYSGDKFDINKHSIVVANYNEDINWLLPYEDSVIIYNKGTSKIPPFSNVVSLPNVGREGHTYLHHIIENYDELSERITFIQADPHLHNDTILYGLDNFDKFMPFQPLGLRWLESKQIPPNPILEKYKTVTSYGLEFMVMKLDSDLNYNGDYYFFDEGVDLLIKNYKTKYNITKKNTSVSENFLLRCEFPTQYMNKSLKTIDFSFSGLFSTIRTNIIIYDKSIYSSLLRELLSTNPQGGMEGYILERLWFFLLDNI